MVVVSLLAFAQHLNSSKSTSILDLLLYLLIIDSNLLLHQQPSCHCSFHTTFHINSRVNVDYLGVSVLISVTIDCVFVLSCGLTPLQCPTLDLTKLAK